MPQQLTKIIQLDAAWDKRNPDPNKNYGIHGVNLTFVYGTHALMITWTVFTQWHLKQNQEEIHKHVDHIGCKPMPAYLNYHTRRPQYRGQSPATDTCPYLNGKCYCDGTSLTDDIFDVLLTQGSDGVWKHLADLHEKFRRKAQS